MKRLILMCGLVMLLAWPCQATISKTPYNFSNLNTTSGIVSQMRDLVDEINDEISGSAYLGTGKRFYVDSSVGADTNTGTKPEWAMATINGAIGLCTADRGDEIVVLQGHNTAITGADGVDCDISGITITGLGNGTLKPTLDYDHANGEFVIGAGNVTIKNLRFRVSANAVTKAIDIETAGLNAHIIGCEFGYAETSTDEFASAIIVAANDVTISGCTFRAGGQAAVSAISVPAAQDNLVIEYCKMFGDYSTAVFSGVGVVTEFELAYNVLFNGTMSGDGELHSEPAIEVANDSSGFVHDNRIVSDVATGILMRVADDVCFMNNFILDTDGDEFSGTKEDSAASIAAHADG